MQRTPGIGSLKRLFLTELKHELENVSLFRDEWTETAHEALVEDAQILFSAGNTDDRFYVIYCRLAYDPPTPAAERSGSSPDPANRIPDGYR